VSSSGDLLHVVTNDSISAGRKTFGRVMIWGSGVLLLVVAAAQAAQAVGSAGFGFENWRPTLYAYVTWAICLCCPQRCLSSH
jgi:multiple sugar transport system permease protein